MQQNDLRKGKGASRFWGGFHQPRTQPSLFHYIRDDSDPTGWSAIDWSFLHHPIRFFSEDWKAPHTQASLFHYIDSAGAQKQHLNWKELARDILASFRSPLFFPSVFSDVEGLAVERAQRRTRKVEAGMVSLVVHVAIFLIAIILIHKKPEPLLPKEEVVFVNNPIYSPFEGNGPDGGGGGGGGKQEQAPPATGRMPDTTPVQMVPPDPETPKILVPTEDLMASNASVQMPIDIPQDQSLPIGDIVAPPNNSRSSGSGVGGGIGTGRGTGIGSGTGAGVGPGSGGGMGGGTGGGIGSGVGPYVVGNGVKPPTALYQPLPAYTEEARKARAEGIVLIQAVIRKDGSVDSFKVLRGLGYGLDESAINTIATKWKFRPGTFNGSAVDVQANIEVSFRLY
jgi:protein TonB